MFFLSEYLCGSVCFLQQNRFQESITYNLETWPEYILPAQCNFCYSKIEKVAIVENN